MPTICTGEIIDPRGEPATADFLNQYNSQLQSKFPQVSVPLTLIKEVCFSTKTNTKIHNGSKCRELTSGYRIPIDTFTTQLLYLRLEILPKRVGEDCRTRGPECLLQSSVFYICFLYMAGSCSHESQ